MSQLIACELHDYIEIACMYAYQLRLTLKNQDVFEGKAVDTWVDKNKREYLVISDGQRHLIELSQLSKLEVLSDEPRFTVVEF